MAMSQFKGNLKNAFTTRLSLDGLNVDFETANDYSITPANFEFRPRLLGNDIEITQLWASLVDQGGFQYDAYGSINNGLPNGLILEIQTQGNLLDPTEIKFNYDYQSRATFYNIVNYAGQPNGLKAEFDYNSFGVSGLVLEQASDDFIRVTCQDDFSALLTQQFGIRGGLVG